MEYRKMEKLGITSSLLGFGCMRFPVLENGRIDEEQSEKMIDKAIKEGVNYIDTAFPYHNGESEPFVGKVLKKYQRESFFLATKLPLWKVSSLEDAKNTFEEQLKRLQVEYVDFYLLHALDKSRWEKAVELGVVSYCEELQRQGKIKYFGFSFHDDYKVFEEILTYRNWDFCQIQYNYMDNQIQAGDKGYQLAEKLGIPMVVMEPIKGGLLSALPEDIEKLLKDKKPDATIASWALRWVGTHPNVKVILSGMSTYEQVLDNLETFQNFKVLEEEEQKVVQQTADMIKSRVKNGCTACRYCMPCPAGVDIPRNFAIWNEEAMYGRRETAKRKYFVEMEKEKRADNCKKCGVCETKCPQAIAIRDNLELLAKELKEM